MEYIEYSRRRPWGGPRRLRRQLFWSFGLAIVVTMLTSGVVSAAIRALHFPAPMRVIAFVAAFGVLWMFSGGLAYRLAWPLWELLRAVKDFGAGKFERRALVPHSL
mgnify:CR=1 FL=1